METRLKPELEKIIKQIEDNEVQFIADGYEDRVEWAVDKLEELLRSTIQAEKEALLEEVIKITKGKGPDLVCPINEPPFSEDYVNQWNLIKRFKVLSELGDKE